MIVCDTPNTISLFQMCAVRGAVKLEALGMRRRGVSATTSWSKEFKCKRSEVLSRVEQRIAELKLACDKASVL